MGSALSGSGSGSLLVLSVSVVGILFTSIILLAYYLFLACSWRRRHSHQTAPMPPLPSFFLATTSTAADQPRRGLGLEEAAIRRIPTLRYQQQQQNKQQQCGVCLGEFREGERLRRLPPCLHSFHIDCIDAWLATALTCPLCRAHVHIAAAAATTSTRQPDDDDQLLSGVHLQPMRRSLSLDSCHLYLAIILHPHQLSHTRSRREPKPAVSESERPSRTLRRSFFSFSHTTTTTSPLPTPILPI